MIAYEVVCFPNHGLYQTKGLAQKYRIDCNPWAHLIYATYLTETASTCIESDILTEWVYHLFAGDRMYQPGYSEIARDSLSIVRLLSACCISRGPEVRHGTG